MSRTKTQVKSKDEIIEDLFDRTSGYDDEPDVQFDGSLPSWLLDEALMLYKKFNGLWGLAIFTGPPGAGKDTVGNYLSYILHKAFPATKLLRDEKPRELFGMYDGLFNRDVLNKELGNMQLMAKEGKSFQEKGILLEKAADEWVTSQGSVKLKNSILYLTEYWNYCYNRDPHNPMNKTMGAVHKVKRHFHTLILGTVQLTSDLDRFTCLPFVDWEIRCHKSAYPGVCNYLMYRCQWDAARERLLRSAVPIYIMRVDGAEPVDYLGEPIKIIDEAYTGSKDENKVLDAVRAGNNTWESLNIDCRIVQRHGILKEEYLKENKRVLKETLRGLYLMKPPVVVYGCWFRLFNSKSPVQINRV